MKHLLLILALGMQVAAASCSQPQQAQTKAQRQPLEKHPHEYRTPTNYTLRERGYDPRTGRVITYDHKPRVELIDARAGKYAFKWIGFDGRERVVIFQRSDAI